ncbi:MAG: hypothetical protein V1792_21805, partial [Pseudomonadota bacterium]
MNIFQAVESNESCKDLFTESPLPVVSEPSRTPKTSEDPKASRFGCLSCEHFDGDRGAWCRYEPGHFRNLR